MISYINREAWNIAYSASVITRKNESGMTTYPYARFYYSLPTDTRISSYNLDQAEQISRSALTPSYMGHTWNPFTHTKLDGILYNLPEDIVAQRYSSRFHNSFPGSVDGIYKCLVFGPGLPELSVPTIRESGNTGSFPYEFLTTALIMEVGHFFGFLPLSVLRRKARDGREEVRGYNGLWGISEYDLPQITIYQNSSSGPRYIYKTGFRDGTLGLTYTYNNFDVVVSHAKQLLFEMLTFDFERRYGDSPIGSSLYMLHVNGTPAISREPRDPNWGAFVDEIGLDINWREIAAKAYQNLGFADINGIAFAKDVAETGRSMLSYARTLSSLPSKKVKGAANLYLATHYGLKLFFSDLRELQQTLYESSLRRSSLSRCQSSETRHRVSSTVDVRYQVFYDEYAQLESLLSQLLDMTDLVLSSENVWDMVPWSFVVDWFVNVGDTLTAIDNYLKLVRKHKVLACGKSILCTGSVKASSLGIFTHVEQYINASYYERWYEDRLTFPSLLPSVTINLFDHLIEAAALTITRM